MLEKLVIVPRVKGMMGKKILVIAMFVITCLLFVLAMSAPVFFTIPAVIFAVVWYFLCFQSDTEYEYTYYDGELRLARIRAKRRRKGLGTVQMEDVIAIAPRGDRSVYKYENDRSMTYKDLTSGKPDARVYELIFKGDRGMNRYEFEPDEDMLDAIMVKYPRLVTK